MELFETMKKRFSYRKELLEESPPLSDLRKIVQAGLYAPSGKNCQTTGFIIITDKEIIKKIHDIPGGNLATTTAQAYVACHIAKKPIASYESENFEVEDCAAATQNILLASTALGYNTVWIDGWLRTNNRAEIIGKLCNLENDRVIRILVPIGKAIKEQRRPEKKGFDERVKIV